MNIRILCMRLYTSTTRLTTKRMSGNFSTFIAKLGGRHEHLFNLENSRLLRAKPEGNMFFLVEQIFMSPFQMDNGLFIIPKAEEILMLENALFLSQITILCLAFLVRETLYRKFMVWCPNGRYRHEIWCESQWFVFYPLYLSGVWINQILLL